MHTIIGTRMVASLRDDPPRTRIEPQMELETR